MGGCAFTSTVFSVSNSVAAANPFFEAVNNLLKQKYRGNGSIIIKQDEIINEIQKLDNKITRNLIFDKKMLDFEKLYRDNGWDESYEAYFEFNKSK